MLSLQSFAGLGVTEQELSVWLSSTLKSSKREAELTRVGHELKRAAEIPVTRRCASANMEDVGSEGSETFDVCVPGGGLDDSVAPLILVLRSQRREMIISTFLQSKFAMFSSANTQHKLSPSRST